MTEKRFTVKQRQGATNYSISDYYGQLPLSEGIYYKSNADKLCKWLNEQHELLNALYHENEQLKKEYKKLKHRHSLLHDECLEQEIKIDNLKQWKKEVFDLIDKKIKEADEGFEQTYDSWYQGQIDALKELKKELQE